MSEKHARSDQTHAFQCNIGADAESCLLLSSFKHFAARSPFGLQESFCAHPPFQQLNR